MMAISSQPSWKLTLDLVTTSNQHRGMLSVYRLYVFTRRDLQLHINLLTSDFPAALADALDRVISQPSILVTASQHPPQVMAANL